MTDTDDVETVPDAAVLPSGAPSARRPSADRTEASRQLAIDIARLALADKCTDVVVLDVKGLSPVTDFLVLATGTSGRQMRSAADDVAQLAKERGYPPLSTSGLEGEVWICVDFVDVLFHVFGGESRSYYDLDGLWGDARRVEI